MSVSVVIKYIYICIMLLDIYYYIDGYLVVWCVCACYLLMVYLCMYTGGVDNLLSLYSSSIFFYVFVTDIEDQLGFGSS